MGNQIEAKMSAIAVQFEVDKEDCIRCGVCVEDCPTRVLEPDEAGYPRVIAERSSQCVRCQHCLAVCATGAVSVDGLNANNSDAIVPESLPTLFQMEHLVRARRSVRQYRHENVDPKLIERLLVALEHAPTGVNARNLTFTVIQDRNVLGEFRAKVHRAIVEAAGAGALSERAAVLTQAVQRWEESKRDILFRGAPHLLIVSSPRSAPCAEQDVTLTLAYFELLAQAAGLGTVWFGFLRMFLEAMPTLKPLVNLNNDDVYYAMLFGASAVKYARSVQRRGSAKVCNISVIA
jgi:nitroreductase/ferredoxin